MHLEKPYINSYGKSKKKKNVKVIRANAEHEAWLRKKGLHYTQIAEKKSKVKVSPEKITCNLTSPVLPSTSDKVGNGFKKPAQTYSGEKKLLGIAVMHKSNLVPVFSKEDAAEISKMRR